MQRALERAERRDHRRVHVGQGRRADPRGERGRVHRVIRVQHQARVQDLGIPRGRGGATQLEQEVGRQAEAGIGGHALTALAGGVVGGDQDGCCAVSRAAFRSFAGAALELSSGSSALARETRLRIASIGPWLAAICGSVELTSVPRSGRRRAPRGSRPARPGPALTRAAAGRRSPRRSRTRRAGGCRSRGRTAGPAWPSMSLSAVDAATTSARPLDGLSAISSSSRMTRSAVYFRGLRVPCAGRQMIGRRLARSAAGQPGGARGQTTQAKGGTSPPGKGNCTERDP